VDIIRKSRILITLIVLSGPLYAVNTEIKSSTGALETVTKPTTDSPNNQGPTSPNRVLPGERTYRKNYLIPALEIPSFLILLNQYDRIAYPNTVYNSGYQSSKNFLLHGPWEYDQDPFNVNQELASVSGIDDVRVRPVFRSQFLGKPRLCQCRSFMWKIAGETDNPSINDQITTGNAGSILGKNSTGWPAWFSRTEETKSLSGAK